MTFLIWFFSGVICGRLQGWFLDPLWKQVQKSKAPDRPEEPIGAVPISVRMEAMLPTIDPRQLRIQDLERELRMMKQRVDPFVQLVASSYDEGMRCFVVDERDAMMVHFSKSKGLEL